MRLLQIVNTLDAADGGPARNSFELNMAFNRRRGDSAQLVYIRGSHERSVLAAHASEIPQPDPRSLRRNLLFAIRSLRSCDAVIVHGYYLWWVPLVILLAGALRKPVALTPHGALTTHQRAQSKGKKRLFAAIPERIIRRGVRVYVVGSEPEKQQLREVIPRTPIEVAGVGTPLDVGVRSPASWNRPLRLVTVGRIAPKKRVDITIDAIAVLLARGVEAEFVIAGVGSDQLVQQLELQSARADVEDRVTFVGQVLGDSKAAVLQESDIFVLPSDDENFGIAVAEALASGLPILVSSAVGAAEGLSWPAGRRISSPTAENVADAVQDLIREDAHVCAVAARRFAEESFSWTEVADRWLMAVSSTVQTK